MKKFIASALLYFVFTLCAIAQNNQPFIRYSKDGITFGSRDSIVDTVCFDGVVLLNMENTNGGSPFDFWKVNNEYIFNHRHSSQNVPYTLVRGLNVFEITFSKRNLTPNGAFADTIFTYTDSIYVMNAQPFQYKPNLCYVTTVSTDSTYRLFTLRNRVHWNAQSQEVDSVIVYRNGQVVDTVPYVNAFYEDTEPVVTAFDYTIKFLKHVSCGTFVSESSDVFQNTFIDTRIESNNMVRISVQNTLKSDVYYVYKLDNNRNLVQLFNFNNGPMVVTGSVWSISFDNSILSQQTQITDTTFIVVADTAGLCDNPFSTNKTNSTGNIRVSNPVRKITPASVPKSVTANQITVYPNPATQSITLDALENSISIIKIFSPLGTLVLETTNTQNVDVTDLAPGLYEIQVFDANGVLSKTARFLKQ